MGDPIGLRYEYRSDGSLFVLHQKGSKLCPCTFIYRDDARDEFEKICGIERGDPEIYIEKEDEYAEEPL
jgi:hypothetical protein